MRQPQRGYLAGGGAGDEVTFGLREEEIKDEKHVAVTRPQRRLGVPAPAPPLLAWVTLEVTKPSVPQFLHLHTRHSNRASQTCFLEDSHTEWSTF